MLIPNVKGQTFAVLGLGKTGLATAAALRASGVEVVVWDDNPSACTAAERDGYKAINPLDIDLNGVAALVLSPGIPLYFPQPHPAVARFRAANIEIIGDIELLFRAQPEATFVGITGTNGKSTTTALIGHILKSAGRKVQVGGNLGTPVLSFDALGKDGIYVLELSSYQLDLIKHNPLRVAVLLNITPDHLDRHGGMEGYIAAKSRIFDTIAQPATLIIGSGEPETRAIALQAVKQKNLRIEKIESYDLKKIVDPALLTTLPGAHNRQNACAAVLACKALGLGLEDIKRGLQSFPGLAHRQQFVAEIGGVRFINDSKATNADAAGKALACYDAIYWIIGGKPKKDGLNGLEPFAKRIRHAFLIGQASDEFARWCEGKMPYTRYETLDRAVAAAAAQAARDKIPDAVVLLSPACASFDQFNNFEERGRMFIHLVERLASSATKAAS